MFSYLAVQNLILKNDLKFYIKFAPIWLFLYIKPILAIILGYCSSDKSINKYRIYTLG